MFARVRGTKVGVHGEGSFIINVNNIKSIEVLRDSKILYLLGDNYGITLREEDFEKLERILNTEDCTK